MAAHYQLTKCSDKKDEAFNKPIIDLLNFLIDDGKERCGLKIKTSYESERYSPLPDSAKIMKWALWGSTALDEISKTRNEFSSSFSKIESETSIVWAPCVNGVERLIDILEAAKSSIKRGHLIVDKAVSKKNLKHLKLSFNNSMDLEGLNALISEGKELIKEANGYDYSHGRFIFEHTSLDDGSYDMFRIGKGEGWIAACKKFLSTFFKPNSELYIRFSKNADRTFGNFYHIGEGIRALKNRLEESQKAKKGDIERIKSLILTGESLYPPEIMNGFTIDAEEKSMLWYRNVSCENFERWVSECKAFIKESKGQDILADIVLWHIFERNLTWQYKNVICVDHAIEVLKDVKMGYLWGEIINGYKERKSGINNLKDVSAEKQCLSKTVKETNQSLRIQEPSTNCYGEIETGERGEFLLRLFKMKWGPGKRAEVCSPIKLKKQAYKILEAGIKKAHKVYIAEIRETAGGHGIQRSCSECEPPAQQTYMLSWTQDELAQIVCDRDQFSQLNDNQKKRIKTAISRLRSLVVFSDEKKVVTDPDPTNSRSTTIPFRFRKSG